MFFNRNFKAATSLIFGAALLATTSVWAQNFPTKQINLVVPYTAGGASDFVARYMAKEMMLPLKQTVIVENASGVAGALGTMKMLNAAPDGYTLLLCSVTEMILTPLINVNAKYKSEDFKTITMVGQADVMLVVRKELNVATIADLIELAKKRVYKPLAFCSPGIGSQFHLITEKFLGIAGAKALHVPYNAFPQCITDLIGQVVDFAFVPVAGPFPGFVDKGNMKLIGIAGAKASARFPNAPLFKNVKYFQEMVFFAWAGIHVSNKVPDDVVEVLNKAAVVALNTDFVKGQIAASGSERFDLMTAKQAHEHYLREVALYRAIAKSINLQPQQ